MKIKVHQNITRLPRFTCSFLKLCPNLLHLYCFIRLKRLTNTRQKQATQIFSSRTTGSRTTWTSWTHKHSCSSLPFSRLSKICRSSGKRLICQLRTQPCRNNLKNWTSNARYALKIHRMDHTLANKQRSSISSTQM